MNGALAWRALVARYAPKHRDTRTESHERNLQRNIRSLILCFSVPPDNDVALFFRGILFFFVVIVHVHVLLVHSIIAILPVLHFAVCSVCCLTMMMMMMMLTRRLREKSNSTRRVPRQRKHS